MRWPIRLQILIPFAALMLAAVAGVSLFDAWLATRRSAEQIEGELRDVARTLAASSFPLTDAVLLQMQGLSGADFVLVDERGQLLATSDIALAAAVEAGSSEPRPTPVEDWQSLELGSSMRLDERDFYAAAISLTPRGPRAASVLYLLYPERAWAELRRQAALPSLAIGLAALGACGLVGGAIAARLSRPIVQLREQVVRIAGGDYSPAPLPPRNDELRELVQSVNRLAARLDDLERAVRRAERLAILGQLGGGLAHHLRNDITGARMAVQLHQRACDHADRESLDVALRQLSLTEEHLQQFLAAGRPESPCRSQCNLATIVAELARLLGPTCAHRRVTLACEDGPALLPDLCADADQLRQTILNLTLNALDAAGPEGWVRIETAAMDREQIVRVIDGGPGAAEADVPRLFEPFFTTRPEGVGFGLAVAKQTAEAHGGRIVYRRENNATCFEMRLPVEAPNDDSPPAPTRSALAPLERAG